MLSGILIKRSLPEGYRLIAMHNPASYVHFINFKAINQEDADIPYYFHHCDFSLIGMQR